MLEYSKKILGFVKADDNSTSSNSNLILYQNQYAKVILGEARGNQYPPYTPRKLKIGITEFKTTQLTSSNVT